jgi:hypothetical protein
MAIIRAAQSGLFSATSSWVGGIVPTSIDDAIANNFNITMDVSTTLLSLQNGTGGGSTNGGQFQFSVAGISVTLTAATPIAQGSTSIPVILVNNTTGTVTLVTTSSITGGGSTGNLISHSGSGAFTFTLPLLTNNGGNVPAIFARSGTGTLTINGNVTGGAQTGAVNTTFSNTGTGAIIINGIVTGGNSSNASGTQAITNTNASATITVNGNVVGGSGGFNASIALNSSGPIVISAGSVTTNSSSIAIIANGGITVNGTVTCNGGGIPIFTTQAVSIVITGNVIVGLAGINVGISASAGSVTLIGNFTNRAGKQAIFCQTIFLSDAVTNALTYNTPGGASRTLYSDDTFPNLPSTSNVRDGSTYGPGLGNTGTLKVPNPNVVLLGNLTDATTGTYIPSSPADFVTELNNSGIPVAVRMRNCATVATTGGQIASYGV